MVQRILDALDMGGRSEGFDQPVPPSGFRLDEDTQPGGAGGSTRSKRLVECLPELNKWAKGVWEGIPAGGVEVGLVGSFFFFFLGLLCPLSGLAGSAIWTTTKWRA